LDAMSKDIKRMKAADARVLQWQGLQHKINIKTISSQWLEFINYQFSLNSMTNLKLDLLTLGNHFDSHC
jgi:hypothetical protein